MCKLGPLSASPRPLGFCITARHCALTYTSLGKDNYDQVEIPLRLGRIPIQIRDEEYDGPKSIVACVHVSMKLRLDRWLGRQKVLYIVDAGFNHE